MSTHAYAVRDSVTMLRRNLLHAKRYPISSTGTLVVPILLLLAFAGLFGNALSAGLGAISNGAIDYTDYLTPAVIVIAAASGGLSTALSVHLDMSAGIINRFRTMAISRASVLTGQVAGSTIRTLISAVLVVGIALLLGFRPSASPVEWIAAAGVFAMLTVALTWLTVSFGLLAKTPGGANSLALLPAFLPFVSSAFIPTGSMPAGVRWFAENEPFTPVINTLRGLLTGTPIGHDAVLAVLWCAVLTLAGYLWARRLYNRPPAR